MELTEFREKLNTAKDKIDKEKFRKNVKKLYEANTIDCTSEAIIICIEECSELIQALSKRVRCKDNAKDMILEEMADVTIAMELGRKVFNISNEDLSKAINVKMKRNIERLG